MNPSIINIFKALIPLIAFFVNISIQILSVRFGKNINLFKSIILGFFIGALFLLLGELYFMTSPASEFIAKAVVDLITFTALGYGYFHFLNLGETARRIRLLMEIKEAGELSLDQILNRYNAEEMVEKRLGRLLSKGQVKFEGGKYYINRPQVLNMARIMILMKIFVLGKSSEFN